MERRQWQKVPDPVAPSPTDAADAWDVIEMGILADDFQVELPSERGDPDVVFCLLAFHHYRAICKLFVN